MRGNRRDLAPLRADRRDRRAATRRGFTLIELLAYISLLSAGLLVLAGLEFSASRAAYLERALVELALEGDTFGTRFQDDVRRAVKIERPTVVGPGVTKGALLVCTLPSGGEVRYELDSAIRAQNVEGGGIRLEKPVLARRLFAPGSTQPQQVELATHLAQLTLSPENLGPRRRGFALELQLAMGRTEEILARRTYRFAAAPIAEGSP